eukprot:5705924-Prymnesium_polylepis.1
MARTCLRAARTEPLVWRRVQRAQRGLADERGQRAAEQLRLTRPAVAPVGRKPSLGRIER